MNKKIRCRMLYETLDGASWPEDREKFEERVGSRRAARGDCGGAKFVIVCSKRGIRLIEMSADGLGFWTVIIRSHFSCSGWAKRGEAASTGEERLVPDR